MIVSWGFTRSAVGSTKPSTTRTPGAPRTAPSGVHMPRRGSTIRRQLPFTYAESSVRPLLPNSLTSKRPVWRAPFRDGDYSYAEPTDGGAPAAVAGT